MTEESERLGETLVNQAANIALRYDWRAYSFIGAVGITIRRHQRSIHICWDSTRAEVYCIAENVYSQPGPQAKNFNIANPKWKQEFRTWLLAIKTT